ncbi:ATPase [Draconibacterium sp.]|nr:ATPase [Draconibacterium sp.]
MILIADSGSTKTSWVCTDGNKKQFLQTKGINPFFRNSEDIFQELNNTNLASLSDKVTAIHFYGAGIINEEKANVVILALSKLFPKATFDAQSDLLASAHATLGKTEGIACILGTGSNSCLYDGGKIIAHVPPLGFILGDEGSGSALGRKLVGDYLKGIMPNDLKATFKNKFDFNYAEYLERVYKKEKPNKFLASFVPFLTENLEQEYSHNLINQAFEEFVQRNILQYDGFEKMKISFVGSIAFYFREQLELVLTKNKLKLGVIMKEPLEGLLRYHLA